MGLYAVGAGLADVLLLNLDRVWDGLLEGVANGMPRLEWCILRSGAGARVSI